MKIKAIGRHGKRPTYQAKIGTMPSSVIVVRRLRDFSVGQRIEFAELDDMRGMSVGCTPVWKHGVIWKIEFDRLYVNRL
jgi:hypothetical protein